ncbi:MAG: hypothetical protein JW999_10115 [Methanotrichaceae archaeon]|nr:hypothetical protein [Methanotrichaceae archaeon]
MDNMGAGSDQSIIRYHKSGSRRLSAIQTKDFNDTRLEINGPDDPS